MIEQERWEELLKLGIELSSYQDLQNLLDKIASGSISIVKCQGASIYVKRGNFLDFMATRNTVLEKKLGPLKKMFQKFSIPLSSESVSGYVALSGEILNIPDVAELTSKTPYRFYDNIDKWYDYKTVSMLTLPMLDQQKRLMGILQLINRTDEKKNIIPFNDRDLFIARYLSSIAASALKSTAFNENLKKAYLDTVERLAIATEFRDMETSLHIKRISEYTALLWKKLGHYDEEELLNVRYAAQMHDVGKIGIPDRILQKPGPLNESERNIIEQHTLIGEKILQDSGSVLLDLAAIITVSHHEKWDGTGYPHGLRGEKIPLIGRVVGLADVFDALTSKRVYKPAFSIEKVLEIMRKERGKHFDPQVLDLFLKSIPEILDIYERYKE
jgi:HD-GYP domain-containing protein (c-di-GMP phosphodiesterase class II)